MATILKFLGLLSLAAICWFCYVYYGRVEDYPLCIINQASRQVSFSYRWNADPYNDERLISGSTFRTKKTGTVSRLEGFEIKYQDLIADQKHFTIAKLSAISDIESVPTDIKEHFEQNKLPANDQCLWATNWKFVDDGTVIKLAKKN